VDAAGASAGPGPIDATGPLSVLHVDASRQSRGGQRQLKLLTQGLHRRGVVQAVLCPPEAPLRDGLPVPAWPLPAGRRGRATLHQAVERLGASLVALHDRGALQLVPREGLEVPAVLHRRVDFEPSRWSRRRYRRVHGIVAVSQAVARVMHQTTGGHGPWVEVVHDGVRPPRPVPLAPPARATVLAVGALVPHKGHRTLVAALAHLPDAQLVVAGEGPLRRRLERQARRLGVTGRVTFAGQVEDLDPLRAQASVLVHPSHQEGLGQAVLEALLAGLPVVASAAGGLPEVVRGHGILVPPQRPRRLARAIREALDHNGRWRRALAEDRRRLVARFGAERMVEETLRAYRAGACRGTLAP